jgi:hypothetical protein
MLGDLKKFEDLRAAISPESSCITCDILQKRVCSNVNPSGKRQDQENYS